MDLKEILDLVEKAETGSRDLDARIAVAASVDLPSPMGECKPHLRLPSKSDQCAPGTYWLVQMSGMSLRTAPAYTTSIDSIMEIICADFPGNSWEIKTFPRGEMKGSTAAILPPRSTESRANTPALAICAAYLRAKLAQGE